MSPDLDEIDDLPIDHLPIDEVLTQAEVLFELDAARAEAWASGLLAEFTDHRALVAALREAADARALAVAIALSPLLGEAVDVAHQLTQAGEPVAAFAPFVGTAVASGAWSISDPYGDGTSIVVEYEHADGVRHDLLVELYGDMAVDLLVSPPGVVEAAQGESERPFRFEPMSVDDAYERIRQAIAVTASTPDAPITDAFLLNQALVAARVGVTTEAIVTVAAAQRQREPRPADREGDAFALSTLQSVIDLDGATPVGVESAAAAVRDAWRDGDPEVVALIAEIGTDVASTDDGTLLVRLAGAYVAPGPRVAMSTAAADAIDGLEWADWLGAVVQLVRARVGADASPEQLVRNVNRCPEVTTSIPKRDAPAVASAFECALPAWRITGAIDSDDTLTELGVWLLPQALAAAWRA